MSSIQKFIIFMQKQITCFSIVILLTSFFPFLFNHNFSLSNYLDNIIFTFHDLLLFNNKRQVITLFISFYLIFYGFLHKKIQLFYENRYWTKYHREQARIREGEETAKTERDIAIWREKKIFETQLEIQKHLAIMAEAHKNDMTKLAAIERFGQKFQNSKKNDLAELQAMLEELKNF